MAVRRPLPFRLWGHLRFIALRNAWQHNKAQLTADDIPSELRSTTFHGHGNSVIVEATDGTYRLAMYVGGGARTADLGTESNHPVGIYTNRGSVWWQWHQGWYVEIREVVTPPSSRGGGLTFWCQDGLLRYHGADGVETLRDVSKLVAGVSPIANPSEATAEDVATAFNALLAALGGGS